MASLSVFKGMAQKISISKGLPRYRSELLVARSAGALTMPDLMRKLLCEESVKLPKEDEILEKLEKLEKLEELEEKKKVHKNKQEKYYMLVPREEVEQ
ncbi:TPA: hypothetical protein ACP5VK_004700 [Vibrio parahaemolyticus]